MIDAYERTMLMDEIIKKIEDAGFQWAVCREPDGEYTAYVTESLANYIGDDLSCGLGCEGGKTPAQALEAAFEIELKHNEMRQVNYGQERK